MSRKIGVKVKEKLARTIGGQFTTNEIVNVFTDANIPTDVSLYAKWRITLDAFGKIQTEEGFFGILEEFCHPLNFPDKEARIRFIDELNTILSYENLSIRATDRTVKIVPSDYEEEPEEPAHANVTSPAPKPQVTLPDINTSSYSEKVLELVAGEFGKALSNWNIRKIVQPIVKESAVYNLTNVIGYFDDLFDETPFYTFEDVLQTIRRKDADADKVISNIISTLLHPLNFDADEGRSGKIAEKISKYLKYDKLYVQDIGDGDYQVFSQEEMDEMFSSTPSGWEDREGVEKVRDIEKIKQNKELVRKLYEAHRTLIEVVEAFCQNTKKPSKELNDAYLYLVVRIEGMISQLNLEYYKITFYKPFNKDLYGAEAEWNGTGALGDIRLGPELSWDAVRPSLYNVHSDINKVLKLSEEDTEMSSDEKRLEEIATLISSVRTQKKQVQPITEDRPMKIEITKMPELSVKTTEEETLQKGRKKIALPKFNHTDWKKAEIRFLDEQTVYLTADKKTTTADYETLGFRNEKSGGPDANWKFLLELARNGGETGVINSPIPEKVRQRKLKLADRLKNIFRNDTDPFYDFTETKTYKIKLKLIPPAEQEIDTLGIRDYLDETMTTE